ncbi:zinc carboxypeptidase [Hirsutella rhossiliensis]|uniref:Zinc carboxypeptidase domain-containing protein n=1 Tax=Hirsutella rhossiliensis TaxID=111463 RepID=A0A9P8SL27_9HYPO|nr:zinc carboxypeptidase domain-containing protein [Hirsutella rhossiliensis]KAH0965390.1 zinc carboxypeptidase domain-containing protein [Hirsutella rhossiliensis]
MRFQLAIPLGLTLHYAVQAHAEPSQTIRSLPIGRGNRFKNGTAALTGLGLGERDLGSLLNIDEIQTGLEQLADEFPQVQMVEAPYKTFEGRKVYGAAIGEPRVVIASGISAAERGGPDFVLYFLSDLLYANKTGVGLVYGNQTYTKEQVTTALSAGVAALPLSNPDGAVHDSSTGDCWTKNRNTTTIEGDKQRGGVHLDQNFPFEWKGEDPALRHHVSRGERFLFFPGYAPQSEAETQNMMWFINKFDDVSWYLSLRPAGFMAVQWGWGHADVQTSDAAQNFRNSTYKGCFGAELSEASTAPPYKEYTEPDARASQEAAATRIARPFRGTVVQHWGRGPPSTGASTDWASSGYYGHECGANRINSLTLDPMSAAMVFGRGNCFLSYPSSRSYHEGMRGAGAGLMELLLHAAGPDGEPRRWQC